MQYPSGTTIFDPFVMILDEPLVLEPLPAFLPFGTPGTTAHVAVASGEGTKKSFHWSAKDPPRAPAKALIKPIVPSSCFYNQLFFSLRISLQNPCASLRSGYSKRQKNFDVYIKSLPREYIRQAAENMRIKLFQAVTLVELLDASPCRSCLLLSCIERMAL